MKNLRNNFGIARRILLLATAATMAMFATNLTAQEITASVQGTVVGSDGQAISGATATISDSRDGRSQSTSSDSRGVINFRSVSAGGPYTVRVSAEGYQSTLVTEFHLCTVPVV